MSERVAVLVDEVDDEDEFAELELDDDEGVEEELAYGVADQSLESAVELALVFVPVLEDLVLSVAVAVAGPVERAMLPPRPRSAARLPAAAIFRALRAGCARFLRGVGSGMAHSSGWWRFRS